MPYNFLIHVDTDAHPGLKWSQDATLSENIVCSLLSVVNFYATQF